jgi:hypothetical protein
MNGVVFDSDAVGVLANAVAAHGEGFGSIAGALGGQEVLPAAFGGLPSSGGLASDVAGLHATLQAQFTRAHELLTATAAALHQHQTVRAGTEDSMAQSVTGMVA